MKGFQARRCEEHTKIWKNTRFKVLASTARARGPASAVTAVMINSAGARTPLEPCSAMHITSATRTNGSERPRCDAGCVHWLCASKAIQTDAARQLHDHFQKCISPPARRSQHAHETRRRAPAARQRSLGSLGPAPRAHPRWPKLPCDGVGLYLCRACMQKGKFVS